MKRFQIDLDLYNDDDSDTYYKEVIVLANNKQDAENKITKQYKNKISYIYRIKQI